MHLTSHIITQMAMPLTSHIIAQMDLTSGFGNISFEWNYTHPTLTDHRSKFAKRGKRKMCSFGSCQTRFEFLSQFRKVRNAFECFVTQVQTRLPKTKCVWPMKINVICNVAIHTFLNEWLCFWYEHIPGHKISRVHVHKVAVDSLTGWQTDPCQGQKYNKIKHVW